MSFLQFCNGSCICSNALYTTFNYSQRYDSFCSERDFNFFKGFGIVLPLGHGDIVMQLARHPCLEIQDDVAFIANDVNLIRGLCYY